jgi:hypothetical protein
MSSTQDNIYEIINSLNDDDKKTVIDFAGYLLQKRKNDLDKMLNEAPVDDEPLTEEELKALSESESDLQKGVYFTEKEFWANHEL